MPNIDCATVCETPSTPPKTLVIAPESPKNRLPSSSSRCVNAYWRSICTSQSLLRKLLMMVGASVMNEVICVTSVGMMSAMNPPKSARMPNIVAVTASGRLSPFETIQRTTGSSPSAMNNAIAIQVSSDPTLVST